MSAASAAALVVLYVLAVGSISGQLLDTRVMLAVESMLGDAPWTELLLELISPATVLASLCGLVAGALAISGPAAAARACATVVGTVALSELLKHVLVRPMVLDDAANSLPSGHVSAVAAIGVASFIALPRSSRHLTFVASAAVVALTAVATMALSWHRPSDAVASVLLAIGVGAAVTAASLAFEAAQPRRDLTSQGTP